MRNVWIVSLSLVLLSFALPAEAHKVTKTIRLDRFAREKWHYVARFGCGIGQCDFSFKLSLSQSIKYLFPNSKTLPLRMVVYVSGDTWPYPMNTQDVKIRTQMSKFVKIAELPIDGSSSETYSYPLLHGARTRIYYFFLADLEGTLAGKTYIKNLRLIIDFAARNTDGSYISQEEYGMQTFHLLMAVLFLAFCLMSLSKTLKYYRKEGELDYPFILLNAACFIEFLSLLSEWLHLILLEYTGSGYFVPNLFSSLFSIITQLIVTSLLILVASGWSITYYQIEDVELLVLTSVLVGFFHLVFAILGQAYNDDPFNTHDYENWAGVILIISKVCLFGLFLMLLLQTYRKAIQKLQNFTIGFGLLGSTYLLALPVTVLIVSTLGDLHTRHRAVTISNIVLESATQLLLTYMLTSKKSAYHKVSYKGSSGLPEGKFD